MKLIVYIALVTAIICGLVAICVLIEPLRICIFEREDTKLWKYWLERANVFKYEYTFEDGTRLFRNSTDNNIIAYIWPDGGCSIHWDITDGDSVILTPFDKIHSRKMSECLLSAFRHDTSLTDEIHQS